MALNYELTAINNYKNICWVPIKTEQVDEYSANYTTFLDEKTGDAGYMNPITNVLIWQTMSVGLGEITNKNCKDFYARIHFLEIINGPFLNRQNAESDYITSQEVKDHIGLSTNADSLTEIKFLRRHGQYKLEQWRKIADDVS